jgi:hypothetical protein
VRIQVLTEASMKVTAFYKIWVLTFNRPPCSHFWFFKKIVWLKLVHPLKIYDHTTFHDPTLTGANFAFTSEVRASIPFEMAEDTGLKKCGVEVPFNGMTSAEFNINLLVVQMLLGGIETDGDSRQTEW